mmetsp:Transcript_1935/g.6933  ORF Transcript_1935/g.6933 Transcript_1935/m.6933 type:complete len:201 (-) Transcript_1935:2686-3288(-)
MMPRSKNSSITPHKHYPLKRNISSRLCLTTHMKRALPDRITTFHLLWWILTLANLMAPHNSGLHQLPQLWSQSVDVTLLYCIMTTSCMSMVATHALLETLAIVGDSVLIVKNGIALNLVVIFLQRAPITTPCSLVTLCTFSVVTQKMSIFTISTSKHMCGQKSSVKRLRVGAIRLNIALQEIRSTFTLLRVVTTVRRLSF